MANGETGDRVARKASPNENAEKQAARKMLDEVRDAQPQAPSTKGANGEFRSLDGKEKFTIRENKMTDAAGNQIGELTGDGKIKMADGKVQDLNAFRNNWVFDGTENGQRRMYVTGCDATNGRVFIPDNAGKPREFEVKMGALIDKQSGEQLGMLQPPAEGADGKMTGGAIVMFGAEGPQTVQLDKTRNVVFDLQLIGQTQAGTGLVERQLQGVTTGDGMLNLQHVKEEQTRRTQKAQSELKAIEDSNVVAYSVSYLSGDEEESSAKSAKVTAEGQAIRSEANEILKSGNVSADQLNRLNEATQRAELENGETQKAEKEQPKPIEIPVIDSAEKASTVNGKLRVGHEVYEVRNGNLYRVDSNGGAEEAPCGKLGVGYTVEVEGRQPIALANENRVMMQFTMGGDTTEHRIIGFGRGHNTEHMGRVEGGLVDVNELYRQSDECRAAAAAGNEEYFRNRPYITGGIVESYAGFEDTLRAMEGNLQMQNQNLHTSVDILFEKGFNADGNNAADFDRAATSTQVAMKAIGATSMDTQMVAARCGQTQELVKESAIIAATTVATAGFGAGLGLSAEFGQMAFAGRAAIQVGGAAILGGAVRTTLGASDSSDFATNAKAGMIEGATMGAGAVLGEAARFKQLAEIKALKNAPLTFAEQTALKVAANPYAAKGAEVAGVVTNSAVQTAGFHAANNVRNHRDITDGMDAETLAMGTFAMALGHGVGKISNRTGSVIGAVNESTTNAFTFGTVSGYHNAKMRAREEVAEKLGVEPESVTDEVLMQQVTRGQLVNQALEEGAMAGLMAIPLGAGMHHISKGVERVQVRRASESRGATEHLATEHHAVDRAPAARQQQSAVEVVDNYGGVCVFDEAGRVIETRSPDGEKVRCEYDEQGLSRLRYRDNEFIRTEQGWSASYQGGEPKHSRGTEIFMEPDGTYRHKDGDFEMRIRPNGVREHSYGKAAPQRNGFKFEPELETARAKLEETIAHNVPLSPREKANLMERINRNLEMLEGRAVGAPDVSAAELRAARNGDRFHIERRKAQYGEMLHEATRLLSAGDESVLNAQFRLLLAEEILQNAAFPRLIRQGHNNTCGIAGGIERPLFATDPGEAARIITDIALTGRYTDREGGSVDMRMDRDNEIYPDWAASQRMQYQMSSTRLNVERSGRGYASQILEKTLANLYWQNQTTAPDGSTVRPGDLAYIVVSRRDFPGDTGERVVNIRDNNREYFDQGYDGNPPELVTHTGLGDRALEQIRWRVRLNNTIIGDIEQNLFVSGTPFPISTPAELRTALEAAQAEGELPLAVIVDVNRRPFSDTDNRAQGGVTSHGRHMVTVDNIHEDGTIDVVNNWDAADDFVWHKAMTPEELHNAIWRTPAQPAAEPSTSPFPHATVDTNAGVIDFHARA